MDFAFVNRMAGITRGGGEIWDLKMAEGLEKMGAEVTFYVGKPLRSELPEPIEGFEIVEVPTPHLRDLAYDAPKGIGGGLADIDSRLFMNRTVKKLHGHNHDIIHINSDPRFARVVSRFDVPVTIKMNGPPYSLWYDVVNPFTNSYKFFDTFDAVVATGITTGEIQKRISSEVHTINPGVDTDQFSPDGPIIETDGPTILFVGRFVPAKNLTLLMDAFSRVVEDWPSATLRLIGDGPIKSDIQSKISDRGLQDSVRLEGYVDNNNLPEVYRSSDVFALSSQRENHPITLLEAMSCGTPVVAPLIGAIPEIVEDERTGLLYPSGSVSELSGAIDRILSDPELRTFCSQQAREKAMNNFDWFKNQAELFELFNRVME
jgi:glycosyltransferase involved in cell wall biosynthesis